MGGKAEVNQFLNRNWMQQIRTGYRQSVSGDKAVGRTDSWLCLQHAKCILLTLVLTEPFPSERGARALMETLWTNAAVDNFHQNARNEPATLRRAAVRQAFTAMPRQPRPFTFQVALTQRAATQAGSEKRGINPFTTGRIKTLSPCAIFFTVLQRHDSIFLHCIFIFFTQSEPPHETAVMFPPALAYHCSRHHL